MIGVTSDGTRHPAAPIALAASSVPSRISARPQLVPSSDAAEPIFEGFNITTRGSTILCWGLGNEKYI